MDSLLCPIISGVATNTYCIEILKKIHEFTLVCLYIIIENV